MCQKLEQHLYQTKLEEQAYDGFLKSIVRYMCDKHIYKLN